MVPYGLDATIIVMTESFIIWPEATRFQNDVASLQSDRAFSSKPKDGLRFAPHFRIPPQSRILSPSDFRNSHVDSRFCELLFGHSLMIRWRFGTVKLFQMVN